MTEVTASPGELEADMFLQGEMMNSSRNESYYEMEQPDFMRLFGVQVFFIVIYIAIFVLGIFGNALVCIVVGRNKAMQTVTNFFISNLALSDILLNSLAVPFTPLYTFLQEWIFGKVLCHLVAYAQGTSVYISTLTLTSIAVDRYFVIIYPFKPRMKLTTCLTIISIIWVFSLMATLPYGIFLQYGRDNDTYTCSEAWPNEETRQVFSAATAIFQFVLPFIIITLCYIRVSLKLTDRARARPGNKNSKKEAVERERKRRTNRMLIAMVTIFGICWLPLNLINLLSDVFISVDTWEYHNLCFFVSHAVAMSSTIYNPFLYAWLNENFRKEFIQVLPCFNSSQQTTARSRRCLSERTCNGNETVQETYLPTSSQGISTGHGGPGTRSAPVGVLETIEELTSNSQSGTLTVNIKDSFVKYSCVSKEVEVHNSDSPSKNSGSSNEIIDEDTSQTPNEASLTNI